MQSRAFLRTVGVAALIGSLAAIGANASNASAATNPKISGKIWADTNANNVLDAGEPGSSGKRVVLTSADPGRSYWASRTTGTSGWWGVVVPPGCYNIKYDFKERLGGLSIDQNDPLNDEYHQDWGSPRPIENTIDNVTRTREVCVTTANATDYVSVPPAEWHRLNLRTWNDKNRNGQQDAGEPGIANLKNTPTMWSYRGWTDNLSRSFETKVPSSWGYNTWWLPAGTCGYIEQKLPNAAPYYGHTVPNVGSEATDSDVTDLTPGPTFCIGRSDVTIGSGMIDLSTQPQPNPLTVVGRVWVDTNENGRQDPGEPDAHDGMEITTENFDKYDSCPPTATAKTVGGRYKLVMGHTISCNRVYDTTLNPQAADYTIAAPYIYLHYYPNETWGVTLNDVGSDVGDNDGFSNSQPSPPGCGWDDIACADIPATGAGPITIDFGIVPR